MAERPDLPPITQPLVIVAAPAAPTAPARVLVVDHQAAVRDILQAVLEDEALLVTTAVDAQAALAQVALGRPTLVILNRRLPGPGGDTLASDLRDRYSGLPILITSSSQPRVVAALQAEGKFDYLGLPFELDALLATVERLLTTDRPDEPPHPLTT